MTFNEFAQTEICSTTLATLTALVGYRWQLGLYETNDKKVFFFCKETEQRFLINLSSKHIHDIENECLDAIIKIIKSEKNC